MGIGHYGFMSLNAPRITSRCQHSRVDEAGRPELPSQVTGRPGLLSAIRLLAVTLSALMRGKVPGQLVVQLTERCNGHCPQCGMRADARFSRATLSGDTVREVIDAAARRGVMALSFTGGEPLLMVDELADYLRHAGQAGIPYLRTGTNGFHFREPDEPGFTDRIKRLVDKLANTPLRNFWISMDSAEPEWHEQMRGLPGVVKGIERALPVFHEAGLYPSINLGLNRNIGGDTTSSLDEHLYSDSRAYAERFRLAFEEGLGRFFRLALELGFTTANICYPMSISESAEGSLSAAYAATSQERVVRFSVMEKASLFEAVLRTIPQYRHRLRIFTPLSSVRALIRQYKENTRPVYPCRGGVDFFFVDARLGHVYPCGYRGSESYGRYERADWERVDDTASCSRCDWECFRDPSELAGPLLEGRSHPIELIKRLTDDPEQYKLWFNDLRYYRACRWFDGRKPLELVRLKPFAAASI